MYKIVLLIMFCFSASLAGEWQNDFTKAVEIPEATEIEETSIASHTAYPIYEYDNVETAHKLSYMKVGQLVTVSLASLAAYFAINNEAYGVASIIGIATPIVWGGFKIAEIKFTFDIL
ncbi:MAG: hypothetical protein GX801_05950 [Fibrobacter sp.]|nr:hypothetical protein [Fibrobacter sp.]